MPFSVHFMDERGQKIILLTIYFQAGADDVLFCPSVGLWGIRSLFASRGRGQKMSFATTFGRKIFD